MQPPLESFPDSACLVCVIVGHGLQAVVGNDEGVGEGGDVVFDVGKAGG